MPNSVHFQQIHLALAYRRPKSCFERISVGEKHNTPTEARKHVNRPFTAAPKRCQYAQDICQSETADRNLFSHACVNFGPVKSEETGRKSTQKILVSSALRRPHATHYSQLDSQTLPEQGRRPRQPYRPKSASTMYSYAERPVSASHTSTRLGRPTKASLLRSKSPVDVSSPCSSSCDTVKNKKTCAVRKEYMMHQDLLTPKEVYDYMTSVHSYITGARYNCCRFIDSKSKHKLGLYVSKDGLNTFIINKPKAGGTIEDNDVPDVGRKVLETKIANADVAEIGINTEPHFLSLNKWHGAEWSNVKGRKLMKPSKNDNRRPISPIKGKAIKTQYIDYNTMVHVK